MYLAFRGKACTKYHVLRSLPTGVLFTNCSEVKKITGETPRMVWGSVGAAASNAKGLGKVAKKPADDVAPAPEPKPKKKKVVDVKDADEL